MKNPDERCGWIVTADDGEQREMRVTRDCIAEAIALATSAMQIGFTRIELLQEDRALQQDAGGAKNIEIIGDPGHRQVVPKPN